MKSERAEKFGRRLAAATDTPPSAWDEGFRAGSDAASDALAEDRKSLTALMKSLNALQPPNLDWLALLASDVAVRVAVATVGTAALDLDLLKRRAEAAVAILARDCGAVTAIYFNETDRALLEAEDFGCEIEVDRTLSRGSVRAEAGHAWAADGITEAMDRILKEICV